MRVCGDGGPDVGVLARPRLERLQLELRLAHPRVEEVELAQRLRTRLRVAVHGIEPGLGRSAIVYASPQTIVPLVVLHEYDDVVFFRERDEVLVV